MLDQPLSLTAATEQLTAPGQPFEMRDATVNGIAMRVWRHAPNDLGQVFAATRRYAERDFLVYEDRRVTFEEHFLRASSAAHRLHDAGVGPGDRVCVAARNSPEWVTAFWGAVVSGAIVVPLNAWWTTDELIYGLTDSASRVVFVDEERLERIRPRLAELTALTTVVVFSDDPTRPARLGNVTSPATLLDWNDFVGPLNADASPPEHVFSPEDPVTMFYTSGTTGHPKGAIGTHRNAATNLMNLFFRSQINSLRASLTDEGAPAAEGSLQTSSLLSVPLFHATGCLVTMMGALVAGAKLVMMHHFDARRALKLIERERVTSIGGVPTVAMQILDHPDFAQFDLSSVTSVAYGGAPAPPELVRRIGHSFPRGEAGNGYGLTETSAGVCFNIGHDYVTRPDSCGPVVPVCDVALVPEGYEGEEPPHRETVSPDFVGELWVKGPSVVVGYWNKPEETAKAFTAGWLHTGDVAKIDQDGFVYIVDRAKDMIIRGGENVYSVIVEAAIFEHPDVADCAVVGVPHPTLGEEVAAVIVPRPGRVLEAEEISRHVAARLARFEVPTTVIFRSHALPRNPQGKVLKRELRDALSRAQSATP